MKVNFDIVRIGKFRKNILAEKLLKENTDLLRNEISKLLEEVKYKGSDEMGLMLVIPAKGYRIKICLEGRTDENVRRILSQNFHDSIYKGAHSIIEENIHNPVFPISVLRRSTL